MKRDFNLFRLLSQPVRNKIRRLRLLNRKRRESYVSRILKNKPKTIIPEQTIVVLGMHRSGTSLMASILKELKVDMGGEMSSGTAPDNPKGFVENTNFLRLNDHLLACAGGFWDIPPKTEKIYKLSQNKKQINKIKSVLEAEQNKIFGFKDPRTSLLLELYYPFLKNPYFIVCKRDRLSVAKSLYTRGDMSIEDGLKLYDEYNKRIEVALKKIRKPVLEISFEKITKNPEQEINKIKEFLKIATNKDLTKIIDKRIVHH
jgi:hypothetical protein